MRTITYDLKSLLKLVHQGGFTIPVFQRDFVWTGAQMRLLVDSVSRGYPIGSLLVLSEKSPSMPLLASRPIDAAIRAWTLDEGEALSVAPGMPADSRVERAYVLDGQQRLTSLSRVFLDAATTKSYYVDLKRLLEQFTPAGAHSWARSGTSERVWVRSLNRKEPNTERRERNRYMRCDVVLNPAKSQIYVQEYCEDSDDLPQYSKSERRQAAAAVNSVFEAIRNYQVPVVVIDPESPLEAICRIFETINSTGTKLTTFDLAVARFFPGIDLRRMRDDVIELSPALRRFSVDGERLLQVLALWSTREKGQYLDVTRSTILGLELDYVRDNWWNTASVLDEAYQWAEEHGASPKGAPNDATLVAMAAFLGKAEKPWRQQVAFSTVLEKWYFSKLLQAGARQATNYKMGLDFQTLMGWRTTGRPPAPEKVYLTPAMLTELSPTDVRYRTLQALLAMRARHDIRTHSALKPQDAQDHHIFPASLHRTKGLPRRRLDSICNRVFVSADTNLFFSDREPASYMAEIAQQARQHGVEQRVDRFLHDAAIPGNVSDPGFSERFSVGHFNEFLLERAEIILEQVREVLGDALVVASATQPDTDPEADEEDVEDDE